MREGFVSIMANERNGTSYIGVTSTGLRASSASSHHRQSG